MQREEALRGRKTVVFLSTWIVVAAMSGWAQEVTRGRISGRVLDDSTNAPIVNANVFLASTTQGTATDTVGSFEIKKVLLGSHELVASCVGYEMASVRVLVGPDSVVRVEMRLRPKAVSMRPVVVTAPQPEGWKQTLEKFKALLLGSSEEAKVCRILNPEVIDFDMDGLSHLSAHTDKELVILNPALGYRVHVRLANFQMDEGWLSCEWKSRFEELPPAGEAQYEEWQKNRERAFRGSLRHFLISLVRG
jgi:hypothetical protein